MTHNSELAGRVREALAAQPLVREVKMFGGLSFMVNEAMVVGVTNDGDLLLRADPDRNDEMLTAKGARPAEMGAGRAMGRSWITVSAEAVAAEEDLDFWVDVALEYNAMKTGRDHRTKRTR